MTGWRVFCAAVCTAAALQAPADTLPDAPHDTLQEVRPTGDTALVLRYIVANLPALGYARTAPWMDTLCTRDGLPALAEIAPPRPAEIVIVLMDRAIPRGQPDPDATQFIAAYQPDPAQGVCQWL